MKRLIIALLLIAAICIMATYSLFVLARTRDTLFQYTDEILAEIESGNYEGAYEKSRELHDYWDGNYKTLRLFFRRHQLDELTASVTRLSPYIACQEDSEINAELTRIREMIVYLWESERPMPHCIL